MVRKPGKLGSSAELRQLRRFGVAAFPRGARYRWMSSREARHEIGLIGAELLDRGLAASEVPFDPDCEELLEPLGVGQERPREGSCERGVAPSIRSVRAAMARAYSIRQASGLRPCARRSREDSLLQAARDDHLTVLGGQRLEDALEAQGLLVEGDAARLGPHGRRERRDLGWPSRSRVRRRVPPLSAVVVGEIPDLVPRDAGEPCAEAGRVPRRGRGEGPRGPSRTWPARRRWIPPVAAGPGPRRRRTMARGAGRRVGTARPGHPGEPVPRSRRGQGPLRHASRRTKVAVSPNASLQCSRIIA